MKTYVRPAFTLLILLMALTGVVYPLVVTAIASTMFPAKAGGSLIIEDGEVVGSALIGQPFNDPRYFWSRPSATWPYPYNAAASSGSNLAPTSDVLLAQVRERVEALRAADPENRQAIPVDLVTASASGLDPHISVAGALYQLPRVANARGLDESQVLALVDAASEDRQFGILGEPAINVVKLNLALDMQD